MSQADGSSTPVDEESASPKNKKQRKHPKLFAFFKWSAITFTVLLVVGVVAGYIFYRSVDIPDPNAEFQTETTYVYYADGKTVLGKFETQNREMVELDRVPESMQVAAIAAEDRTFYENRGIDVKGIVRAATNNATSETRQGASTITQQYVKILYLTQDQTYTRKAKEAVLSLKIHNQLSKEEILEGYLNTIYFGRGAYGVQTAAQAFFDVDVDDLNLRQSAALAAIINNPSGYDPSSGPEARQDLKERYDYVLQGMENLGAIDEQRMERAQRSLPAFPSIKTKDRFAGPKGHLLRMVEQQLQEEGFSDTQINGGGLRVVTTFDAGNQKAARKSVREQQQATGRTEAAGKEGSAGLHIGLASVENDTGALRAMYGGPNYLKSQYDWAQSGAQPGSTFKPFAVAAALDDGYSLQSSLNGNSPIPVPGGSIENQGDTQYGTVSLQDATRDSVNTAFIDLMLQMENGPKKVMRAARKAGIPVNEVFSKQDRKNPPWVTPLGYAPVSVIDMASGFSTFANDGKHAPWYVIEEVEDDDKVVFKHKARAKRAFSSDIAADVTYAMQQVVSGGSGTSAATVCPTAGKTGTATATKPGSDTPHVSSAWFGGMTPELSTAVMYARGPNGNGDLQYMNQEKGDYGSFLPEFFGGTFPAQTFKGYMDAALEGTECGEFADPAYVDGDQGETYVPPSTPEEEEEEEDTLDPGLGDDFEQPPNNGPPNNDGNDNNNGGNNNNNGPPNNDGNDNNNGGNNNNNGPPNNNGNDNNNGGNGPPGNNNNGGNNNGGNGPPGNGNNGGNNNGGNGPPGNGNNGGNNNGGNGPPGNGNNGGNNNGGNGPPGNGNNGGNNGSPGTSPPGQG